jgi:hypothetical protein
MGESDLTYKEFLSDREFFLRFLKWLARPGVPVGGPGFEVLARVSGLKPEDLHPEDPASYLTDMAERRGDILWRVRLEEGDCFVFVLLEHQTRTDYLMAFRLLGYMVHIWEKLVREAGPSARRKSWRLPPILPVVLHTGGGAWKAERTLAPLIARSDLFPGYQPDFRYHCLSLGELSPEELLEGDPVGLVFYAGHPHKGTRGLGALKRLASSVARLTPEDYEAVRSHFAAFYRLASRGMGVPRDSEEMPDLTGEEGEENMLSVLVKELIQEREELKEELKARWLKEGLQEGLQTGRQEGHSDVARRMLQRGMSPALVAELTGLSPEEVAALLN